MLLGDSEILFYIHIYPHIHTDDRDFSKILN